MCSENQGGGLVSSRASGGENRWEWRHWHLKLKDAPDTTGTSQTKGCVVPPHPRLCASVVKTEPCGHLPILDHAQEI